LLDGTSMRLIPIGARTINTRPVPEGTSSWGSAWKKGTVEKLPEPSRVER